LERSTAWTHKSFVNLTNKQGPFSNVNKSQEAASDTYLLAQLKQEYLKGRDVREEEEGSCTFKSKAIN